MTDDFDKADYYDCDVDAERLRHETVLDAIEAQIDGSVSDATLEADLREFGDITVYAWRRETVPYDQFDLDAECAVDAAIESFAESEYADPDGGTEFSKVAIDIARKKISAAMHELACSETVWACDRVAERTYTPDEAIAMLREERGAA